MFYSSRAVALLLGISISIVSATFLSLFEGVSFVAIILTAIITFSISYFLIYLTYRYFIFDEINKLYKFLSLITKEDYSFTKESTPKSKNPLKMLSREISRYAKIKEEEIKELKNMESYRKEFLADVSHELKTPIFAAQGFIHTLLDGAISDKNVRKRFLKKAGKSLSRLDKLVEDLLIISQMETGSIKMNFSNFNLYNLILEIFDQLEDKAVKKSLVLCFVDTCPDDVYVYADKQKIYQVLLNLVLNGINYTQSKNKKVSVDLKMDSESVKVIIMDEGIGITSEDIKRIFERFYRVDKSRSTELGGTGLGLSIVKHILEAHSETVEVTSQAGDGSTFAFHLPKGRKDLSFVENPVSD